MYSYFTCGVLFLVVIVHAHRVPYGYSTRTPSGYNFRPSTSWNNPNYNIQTNEIWPNTNEKVKVRLYYESLCPDCIMASKQLSFTVQKLAPYLDIKTYPYGNAQTIDDGHGNVTFICQHGVKECYGNKLHACAIDSIRNVTMSIVFNACLMVYESNNRAADTCGQAFFVDSATIKACAQGERGTQLLKYYGDESKKVGFKYVPYVLINGVESDENNLMQNVCKAFKSPPPECQGYV